MPGLLRWPLLFVLVGLVPLPALCADNDAAFSLTKDGLPIALQDGLTLQSGGEFKISRRDLEHALGVDVRRLIPRPTPRRNRRKPQPRTWILCYSQASARYTGAVGGAPGSETFALSAVARVLRWTLRRQGQRVILRDRGARRARRGGRPGDRLPDLVLPGLDGTRHGLHALRGRRVLIVVWASWSESREALATWAVEWGLRQTKNLDLLAVAVDLEGASRVRSYVPPDIASKVVLDRDGVLPGLLGGTALGRFALIDDLGLVRAVGDGPSTVDLAWIDEHLREPGREASPEERLPPPAPALAALRRAVERAPRRARVHAALAEALEPTDPDAALASQKRAFALAPASAAIAMRLARMELDRGQRPRAIETLDTARRARPASLWLRRQFWALDEPDRYYSGPIDHKWESEQRKQEDEAWGRIKRRSGRTGKK